MKKILSVAASIVLAAALISCGDTSDFDGATDTVITVGTPKVTAKAYPGVNYISWEPIAQAKAYELYRTEDGVAGTDAHLGTLTSTNLQYADVAGANAATIVDGKSYKYTVIAVGANGTSGDIPTRAVYLKSSSGSASVTAKVPQAGTAALDLNKSYAEKLNEKNVSKNVTVKFVEEGENAGKIYYEYLATAAYTYKVAFLEDGKWESAGTAAITGTATTAKYIENYKIEATSTPTNPGKYNVFIAVDSVASSLYPTSYVNTGITVEVAKLVQTEVANTDPKAAVYTAEKTARVYWTPAKDADGVKYFPTSSYKVYRNVATALNEAPLTALDAAVVEGVNSDGKTIYYIDDTLTDNTVSYKYTIVLTDGVRYGTAQTVTLDKRTQTGKPTVTATASNFNKDGLSNDIKVVIKAGADAKGNNMPAGRGETNGVLAKADKTVKLYWINLAEKTTTTAKAEWTEVALTKTDAFNYDAATDTYTWYKEDAAAGVYLFKAVASEDGYLDSDANFSAALSVEGKDKVVIDYDTPTAGVATNLYDNTKPVSPVTPTDAYTNYTYSLLTVTETTATSGKVTVTSSTPKEVTLDATGTYPKYEVPAIATIDAGVSITYYLIRTRKAAN